MNYVAVARNLAEGRGLTQPTLGFNQPRIAPDSPIPSPYTAQGPLYPLAIAVMGTVAPSYADAALLVAALGYGLILLLTYLLTREWYGSGAALLATGLLLVYHPVLFVARYAWSEPVGIALVLLSFWLLARSRQATTKEAALLLLAGLAAGLAFATRYLLLVAAIAGALGLIGSRHSRAALRRRLLFETGTAVVIEPGHRRRALRRLLLFGAGAALPVLPILARNLSLTGALTGAHSLPSQRGLEANLRDAFLSTFGRYLAELPPEVQPALLAASLLLVVLVLARRRQLWWGLTGVLWVGRRYVLVLWSFGYLALLVLQRTQIHFDQISPRLTAPAGVTLVILWAALVVEATALKPRHLVWVALVLALLAVRREGLYWQQTPPYDTERVIAASERLTWVATQTTARDLIVGDDTMDVPFYFGDRHAVSFSPYPYTEHPDYEWLLAVAARHGGDYERVFLVLRRRYGPETAWRAAYGPFIADLVAGRAAAYPAVAPLRTLADGYVFQVGP